jgi:hypothetical protein
MLNPLAKKPALSPRRAAPVRPAHVKREADSLHPRHNPDGRIVHAHDERRRTRMEIIRVDPWYRATTLRRELQEGRSFNPDEFAIALEHVVAGTAPADYCDPGQFFARTYITAAMRAQIGTVLRRLAGETDGAPPVLSFVTQFGGGKTHTLAALWHLAGLGPEAASLPGLPDLLASQHLPTLPHARRGVFVGNAWDPRGALRTPWLDLAWQLAGDAGIATLGDAAHTSPPGTEALARLFALTGQPILVLMDEVLNFINRHRSLADRFYAFLDNLVRAATGTRHVAVVLSLPRNAVEMTQYEQDWQDRIGKIVRRVARDLVANDESEISEIVRRRLFEDLGPERIRTQVAKAYADWCFEHRAALPPHWTSVDPTLTERRARDVLIDRFAACYPFHPATLSVFQRKWQSLPQYQQTRGTLGLLAQWLSRRYAGDHDQMQAEPLITLGSAPMEDRGFRAAMLGQLSAQRLAAAIDKDIVADTSQARALDADTKGALKDIHRQIGTAILFESAGGEDDRAAGLPELRFALGGPQVDTTSIDMAAAALESRAFFIRQVGADGYRLTPKAKLNMVVAEKRASLDEDRDVLPEARRLVELVFEMGSPVPVIVSPGDAACVRDAPRLRLLVADPTEPWDGGADMREFFREWTYRRGKETRLFPASLIWCLRQPGHVLLDRVETALAWRAVRQDLVAGLLGADTDPQEARGIDASIRTAEQEAREAVWADYRYLLFADRQEPSGIRVIDLGAGHSSSRETLAGRALAALRSQGLLEDTIGAGYVDRKWPPSLVPSGAWPLSGLRQSFLDGSMTRLLDPDHLLQARIAEWVETGEFGLAAGARASGAYDHVWYRQLMSPAEIAFDADVYLLKKATAVALRARDDARPVAEDAITIGAPADTGTAPPDTPQRGARRITIRGDVPPEQWNRLGTRLLPRLRDAGAMSAAIALNCDVDAARVRDLVPELERALRDLGLTDHLTITLG